MKIRTFLLALLLVLPLGVAAQKSVLRERTAAGVATMISWRDTTSGVWKTAGWWNSANVLTALLRYGSVTGDAAIPALAADVFDRAKAYKWVDSAGRDRLCASIYKGAASPHRVPCGSERLLQHAPVSPSEKTNPAAIYSFSPAT